MMLKFICKSCKFIIKSCKNFVNLNHLYPEYWILKEWLKITKLMFNLLDYSNQLLLLKLILEKNNICKT